PRAAVLPSRPTTILNQRSGHRRSSTDCFDSRIRFAGNSPDCSTAQESDARLVRLGLSFFGNSSWRTNKAFLLSALLIVVRGPTERFKPPMPFTMQVAVVTSA